MSSPDVRVVGRVVKPHGIRGELVVDVHTDSPEERFTPGAVLATRARDGASGTVTIAAVRPHTGRLLVTFQDVAGRDAAEALRGLLLLVDAAELTPSDDPEEFYDHELEGLEVVDVRGDRIGVVAEVLHTAASELLAVRRDDGSEVLVPFVTEIVPTVDVAAGRVVVDPPEGLLDA
ncbi:ribosome maturation factor RimM [Kutzneria sp. 744]|uniref:ribosome maturation factor RimM n=1 Tax=Kutzneria sp. (strain 744) TaxID=345341 RepID=UPI0003EEB717|nr:ribosome maturation factor RimM [Kutzneria sp. 744]EWM16388.1 16S rRNA processing protein RimM [Kutzneria sp. 744]